jgi:NAD(P)-dependent dehydrogenase (short-subunit alcohol dehydrogenase family)
VIARLAVVTGAGSGIGQASALRLAARGLTVLCVGRDAGRIESTRSLIEAAGGSALTLAADCGTSEGIERIGAVADTHEVKTLVCAAGADTALPFAKTSEADFDRMWTTNVRGPFFLTQRLLPRLIDGASVVFVGSVSASRGRDRHAAYGTSKAALFGLTVNLAVELGPHIRVNTVSPGATRTAMLKAFVNESIEGLTQETRDRLRISDTARNLLGRIATPDEVAATVVHVALDATAMTGTQTLVDLGYAAS